jgi:hypothetical protein
MHLYLKAWVQDRECEIDLELDEGEVDYSSVPDKEFEELINVMAHRNLVVLRETLQKRSQKIVVVGG